MDAQNNNSIDLSQLRFDVDRRGAQQIKAVFGLSSDTTSVDRFQALETHRQQLRGNAIRITPELLPDVAEAFRKATQTLGVRAESGDLYIEQNPEYNARILSDGSRFDVIVHSSLVRDFTVDELRFVFGHELGHQLYRHFEISLPCLFEEATEQAGQHAQTLFQWSRAAEISADRIGLLCTESLDSAVSALFKITSGLCGIAPQVVMNCFRDQYDELREHIDSVGGQQTWARTHPLAAIRFKAIEMASLDVMALRVQPSSFSWQSFRKLDLEIGETLEALETTKAPTHGLRAQHGQVALVTTLLFVALKDAKISWQRRWFLHDVHKALTLNLSIERMIDAAINEWGDNAGQNGNDDLRQAVEHLALDERRRILDLCCALPCANQSDQSALQTSINKAAQLINVEPPTVKAQTRNTSLSPSDVWSTLGL